MKFTIEKLIGCPAKKKSRKWKRDDSETETGKEGVVTVREVPASLEGIVERSPRVTCH